MSMPGGLSKAYIGDKMIQLYCDGVKEAVEVQMAKVYAVFSAICYKLQNVAGTNYFIKVHVGDSECLHLRVNAPLPCNGGGMKLDGIQGDKALDDPIVPF